MQQQIEARAGLNGGGAAHDSVAACDGGLVGVGDALPIATPPRAVRRSVIQDILEDPVRREALRRRIEEGIESINAIAEDIGVSGPTLGRIVKRLRWIRPPDAPKAPRRKGGPDATNDRVAAVKARLLATLDRQIGLVEKRLKGKTAEVEEKDSRILGNLAKTLGALIEMGKGGKTSKDMEPPDRGDDAERRLAERIKKWARGEQGY